MYVFWTHEVWGWVLIHTCTMMRKAYSNSLEVNGPFWKMSKCPFSCLRRWCVLAHERGDNPFLFTSALHLLKPARVNTQS